MRGVIFREYQSVKQYFASEMVINIWFHMNFSKFNISNFQLYFHYKTKWHIHHEILEFQLIMNVVIFQIYNYNCDMAIQQLNRSYCNKTHFNNLRIFMSFPLLCINDTFAFQISNRYYHFLQSNFLNAKKTWFF